MLTRFADIRPSERRNVVGGFLTLLGAMVSHSILETARDALFLASLPASKLPWVYLGIAAAAFILGRWWSSAHNRTATTGDLVRTFLLVAIGTLAFAIVVGSERIWTLYAVYIWSGVVITVVMLRFWTLFG